MRARLSASSWWRDRVRPALSLRVLPRMSCGTVLHGSPGTAGVRPLLVAEAGSAQGDPIRHREPAVPFKHHAEHRHHIPKPRYRVTNWPEYDEALRRRGSLTVWFTDEAIVAWRAEPRTTPGGQPYYSALAIATALTIRAVFSLALRQTEGLIGSIIALLGLTLTVPDHSTRPSRTWGCYGRLVETGGRIVAGRGGGDQGGWDRLRSRDWRRRER